MHIQGHAHIRTQVPIIFSGYILYSWSMLHNQPALMLENQLYPLFLVQYNDVGNEG